MIIFATNSPIYEKVQIIDYYYIGRFFLNSCATDGNPKPEEETVMPSFPECTADVYLAGYEYNSNGIAVAKYWENRVAVMLSDGTRSSKAISIAISNNDVYVLEREDLDENKGILKYWKNVEEFNVIDGSTICDAYSIDILDDGIFVAGMEFVNQYYVAKYWKSVIPSILSQGRYNTQATFVLTQGNDIYIAGRGYDNNLENRKIILWKNDVRIVMQDSIKSASSAMAISNQDIYIAGFESYIDNSNVEVRHAKYWKNGQGTILNNSSYSRALDIDVSGNDVFIAGDTGLWYNNISIPVYWKNGNMISLLENGTTGSAKAIVRSKRNLYIVGNRDLKGVIWIDDKLFFTTKNTASFNDIKVVMK